MSKQYCPTCNEEHIGDEWMLCPSYRGIIDSGRADRALQSRNNRLERAYQEGADRQRTIERHQALMEDLELKRSELKLKKLEMRLHKKGQAKALHLLSKLVSNTESEATRLAKIEDERVRRNGEVKLANIMLAAIKLTLTLSGMPTVAQTVENVNDIVENVGGMVEGIKGLCHRPSTLILGRRSNDSSSPSD